MIMKLQMWQHFTSNMVPLVIILNHLESLEHLFTSCPIITTLWTDLIDWCNNKNIEITSLCDIDKMFGLRKRKDDFLLLNHIVIYYCETIHLLLQSKQHFKTIF